MINTSTKWMFVRPVGVRVASIADAGDVAVKPRLRTQTGEPRCGYGQSISSELHLTTANPDSPPSP